MDRERFSQLNGDPDRIQQIKQQLRDPGRDWIRVDVLKGRKSAPPFYCLVPRRIAELPPICDQAGRPIVAKNNIVYAWMMGMKRAGFTDPRHRRFGPHNLRSVWLSEAQRRKLDPVLMQHQLGHVVDALNYQRIQQDDQWATSEFRKAWQTQEAATTRDLSEQDSKIDKLERELVEVTMFLQHMSANWQPTPPSKKLEEKYLSWDPKKFGRHLEKTRKTSKAGRPAPSRRGGH